MKRVILSWKNYHAPFQHNCMEIQSLVTSKYVWMISTEKFQHYKLMKFKHDSNALVKICKSSALQNLKNIFKIEICVKISPVIIRYLRQNIDWKISAIRTWFEVSPRIIKCISKKPLHNMNYYGRVYVK